MSKIGKRTKVYIGLGSFVLAVSFLAYWMSAAKVDSPDSARKAGKSLAVRRQGIPRQTGITTRRAAASKAVERMTGKRREEAQVQADVPRFRSLMQTLKDRRQKAAVRIEALKEIKSMTAAQQVYCISELFSSDSQSDRVVALQGVQFLFSQEARKRDSGTSYRDLVEKFGTQPSSRTEVSVMGGGDTAEITVSDGLLVNTPATPVPVACQDELTARETAEVNTIVKLGMVDESPEVWKEALRTAGTLDITACNAVYQYAVSAGSDEVRQAVLDEAKVGDDAFRLCLEFSALDVAGEALRKTIAEDIRKTTGQDFGSSEEAFMWYEQNQANSQANAEKSTP